MPSRVHRRRPSILDLTAPLLAASLVGTLALGLTGCADDGIEDVRAAAATNQPPSPPGVWPDRVDGDYKGTVTAAEAAGVACPPDSHGIIEIGDRRLYFAYQPNVLFVAPIQADGTVFARSGSSTLEGTMLGDRLAFTVRTPACASSYDLRWVL